MAPPSTIAVLNGTSRVNQHIIQQSLARGQRVRAIVRSSQRFYSQTKKHDDLEAHEWSDFADLDKLAPILEGVDVLYIALCAPADKIHEPTWLNADAAASVCSVLRNNVAPGSRCATKVVLLAAYGTIPSVPRRAVGEFILGHQFNDLRATQSFLLKQKSWLDVVYVMPGVILDSESSADAASSAAVELREGTVGGDPVPISYARLASAMQTAGADERWAGKFATPYPTTNVPKSLRHFSGAIDVLRNAFTRRIVPSVGNAMFFVALGSTFGYVLGSRDGGAWALRTLGINVRNI